MSLLTGRVTVNDNNEGHQFRFCIRWQQPPGFYWASELRKPIAKSCFLLRGCCKTGTSQGRQTFRNGPDYLWSELCTGKFSGVTLRTVVYCWRCFRADCFHSFLFTTFRVCPLVFCVGVSKERECQWIWKKARTLHLKCLTFLVGLCLQMCLVVSGGLFMCITATSTHLACALDLF